MNRYGLIAAGWQFNFDKAKRRFGLCDHGRRRLQLSEPLTRHNEEPEVRNTILHEIAHALVGHGHGHDEVWRRKAVEIGCDGKRCHSAGLPPEQATFIGTCPKCGATSPRYQQPRQPLACSVCCRRYNRGKFDNRFVFVWTANHGRSAPIPVALPGEPNFTMPPGKVSVFLLGSSRITDREAILWCLKRFDLPVGVLMHSSDGKIETTGEDWARKKGCRTLAGFEKGIAYDRDMTAFVECTLEDRTEQGIFKKANLVLAIWDGTDAKTRRIVECAIKQAKPTIVFNLLKRKISRFNLQKDLLLKDLSLL